MTVWRYTDVGYQILDESTSNVDVEGINWAPFDGGVSTDFFTQFEMSVAHSRRLPDEYPVPITMGAGGYANYPNSGLNKTFLNNILGPPEFLKLVHPRDRGYLLTPSQVFASSVSTVGTRLMPYPMNRQNVSPENFEYYTWRDTSILNRAGPQGFGADVRALATVGALECNGAPNPTTYEINQVRTLALPLLMEFKCFPDNAAVGLNGLRTRFALATERNPIFRVYSTGGFKSSGAAFVKNPDAQDVATGGFNGATGNAVPGDDNTVMIGQLDIVVRVSRVHSIWLDTRATPSGLTSPPGIPDFFDPIVEPRPDEQPNGTSVVFAYRGASKIAIPAMDDPMTPANEEEELLDARLYDAYGDPVVTRVIEGPTCPDNPNMLTTHLLTETTSNFSPVFYPSPNNEEWTDNLQDLDGAEYLQVRITFVSNAMTGLSPELSTLAIPFLK